ncbi:hypothetical protein [Flavobacterium phage FPSV-S29]|nr:hypothetical protein [Flavobacterium phage FPSV-S29]
MTAENFMNQWITKSLDNNDIENLMIEFAKLHVEAALKEASDKAEIDFLDGLGGEGTRDVGIVKSSILKSYSLTLIK